MLRKIVLSAAAASLATASVSAQAAEVERASSGVTDAESMVGEGASMFYLLGFLAALAALVVLASEDGNSPASP